MFTLKIGFSMNIARNPIVKSGAYLSTAGLMVLAFWQHSRIADLQQLVQAASARSSSPVLSPKPPASGISAPPSSAAVVRGFDEKTLALLAEVEAFRSSLIPGQVNEAYQRKAWDVLFDNNASRRSRNFELLLDALQPGDGAALHVLFNKMHQDGRDFPEEYARFATRWGEVDGAGAMGYYFAKENAAPAPADVHNALKGWAQRNPQEAMAWALANREMVAARPHSGFGPQDDPVVGVLRGWARQDIAAATAAMKTQFPDPGARMQATETIYQEILFGKGLDSTLDWIKQLPDAAGGSNDAGRSVLQNLFKRIRDAGASPDKVVGDLIKVADQPWFGIEDMEGISHTFRRNAGEFANALGGEQAQPVLREKFKTWAGQNPDAVGNWLNANRGTAIYDLGAAELAHFLRSTDPDAAARWADTIQDPALKARATQQ